jgi:hypothetical protein
LLFESNYDGSQTDYLRTFADIVPARLAKLWGACFGFETATGASPRGPSSMLAVGFRLFVERNQLDVVARYAAYPNSTATDVRQAIALHELAADFTRATGEDSAPHIGDIATTALGPAPPRLTPKECLRGFVDPWRNAIRGRYGVNPLSIVTPLDEGRAKELRRVCKDSDVLAGLAETETHFARLVIIPRDMTDVGQPNPDVLPTPYLLFTSDAWGTAYDQIEAIRKSIGDIADFIWGACDGYKGHQDAARFHAWIDSRTLPTAYYIAGYPPYPASTVNLLLRERAAVADKYGQEPHPPLTQLLGELDLERD